MPRDLPIEILAGPACGRTLTGSAETSHPALRFVKAGRGLADASGASAVEFALVAFPFLALCLGVLQFVFLHYTQQTLSDALYSSASNPEAELISGSKSGYIAKICAKIAFQTDCLSATNGIKVEMMRLDDLSTTTTAITGSTFTSGTSGDVLVLRATMPTPKIVAFIPQLTAKDSVIFRRP